MTGDGGSSSTAGPTHEVTLAECFGPGPAAPSLHLLDLPTELLLEMLRDAPRAVRATCRTFRSLLDGGQKALSLRPQPDRGARQLAHLTALLHRLPSLACLTVDRFEFRWLTFLTACPALESLALADARHLFDEALASLAACQHLQSLDLNGCTALRSIHALPTLTALRSLDLGDCGQLAVLAPLSRCPNVTSLTLGPRVSSLGPLTALTALASLVCHGGGFTDLVGLAPCTASLTLLHVTGTPIADLTPLSGHSRLTSLVLDCGYDTTSLAPLALFGGALTHLHLEYYQVTDIAPLSACTALTSLHLAALHGLLDIGPLSRCTALLTLVLRDSEDIASLAPLSPLGRSLTSLNLRGCFAIDDVSPLAHCSALRHLDLSRTSVASVAPLAACTLLRVLLLSSLCPIPHQQLLWLCPQLPQLWVHYH